MKYFCFALFTIVFAGCCKWDPSKIVGNYSCKSDKGYEEIAFKPDSTFIYYAHDNENRRYYDSGQWHVSNDKVYGGNFIVIESIHDYLFIYYDSFKYSTEYLLKSDSIIYQQPRKRAFRYRCGTLERRINLPYDFKKKSDMLYLK